MEWHARLGHADTKDMKRIVDGKHVQGAAIRSASRQPANRAGEESRKTSAGSKARRAANQVGEVASAEIHDATAVGASNERCASVITDHFTGFASARCIASKSRPVLRTFAFWKINPGSQSKSLI